MTKKLRGTRAETCILVLALLSLMACGPDAGDDDAGTQDAGTEDAGRQQDAGTDETAPSITLAAIGSAGCTDTTTGLPLLPRTSSLAFASSDDRGVVEHECLLTRTSDGAEIVALVCNAASPSDCGCTSANGFAYAAGSGEHVATVTARDAAGHATSDSVTFVVDDTLPQVTFLAPTTASTTEPYADMVPAETTVGTFSVDDSATSVACSIDGTTRACSSSSYPLDGLTEGQHTLQIRAADCAGNEAIETLAFFVDAAPPSIALSSTLSVVEPGSAVVQITTIDTVSNIESMTCRLDGVAIACPFVGGTLPSDRTGYSGTASLSALGPGTHVLSVDVVDRFGHSSSDFASFVIRLEPGGHVVLLGFDLSTAPTLGAVRSQDAVLLGNAVTLSPSLVFGRPLRVLLFDGGTVSPAGEASNVIATISDALERTGAPAPEVSTLTISEELTTSLRGHDVLLLPDQNNPELAALLGNTLLWSDTIQNFTQAGGVVIVLDGEVGGSGVLSANYKLAGRSLPAVSRSLPLPNVVTSRTCSRRPMLVDVDEQPSMPPRSVMFDVTLETGVMPLITEVCTDPGCAQMPLALDVPWPRRGGSALRIRANDTTGFPRSSADVVVSSASGVMTSECLIQPDGQQTIEIDPGDGVTVADRTTTEIDTVLDLEPGSAVQLGPTRGIEEVPTNEFMEVAMPFYPTVSSYFVTNGCESGVSDGAPVRLGIAPQCRPGGGNPRVFVAARDGSGNVLAYTSASVACAGCIISTGSFAPWQESVFPWRVETTNLPVPTWTPSRIASAIVNGVEYPLHGVSSASTSQNNWMPWTLTTTARTFLRLDDALADGRVGRRGLTVARTINVSGTITDDSMLLFPTIDSTTMVASTPAPAFRYTTTTAASVDAGLAGVSFVACGAWRSWEVAFSPTATPQTITLPDLGAAGISCATPEFPAVVSWIVLSTRTQLSPAAARASTWDAVVDLFHPIAQPSAAAEVARYTTSYLPLRIGYNGGPSSATPIGGNASGGTRFDDECPEGEALVGLDVEIASGGYLGGMRAVCGRITAEGPIGRRVRMQPGTVLPARGQALNAAVRYRCPVDHVVYGFTGNSGWAVDSLALFCAPMSVDGRGSRDVVVHQLGDAHLQAQIGGSGGTFFGAHGCPPESVARGAVIRAGAAIDAFGLLCNDPLVYE